MTDRTDPQDRAGLRRLGAMLQGLVLGILLTMAVLQLIILSTEAQIFRYQGF